MLPFNKMLVGSCLYLSFEWISSGLVFTDFIRQFSILYYDNIVSPCL